MASDGFPKVELGPLCLKIGSGATPRGGSKVYLDSGDVALIRSQNVYNDGFTHDGLVYITEEYAEQLSNVTLKRDDVLLNITGDSVARCCQVNPNVLPARVNQHVAIIRPNPQELYPGFLRYFLVSPAMQGEMLSWSHAGATRKALTKGMIESFKVPKPDLPVQQRIADVLGKLDDKIELNRRMNRTLEKMAAAIFKSFFLDFLPVLRNARTAGNPIPPRTGRSDPERSRSGQGRRPARLRPPLPRHLPTLPPRPHPGWVESRPTRRSACATAWFRPAQEAKGPGQVPGGDGQRSRRLPSRSQGCRTGCCHWTKWQAWRCIPHA